MRVGIAHHFGWAVVVTATAEHRVVDRRRIELVEDGLSAAPIHHEGGTHEMHRSGPLLGDDELAELVATVRASALRATATALDELAAVVREPIRSVSVRAWPEDFPTDIAVLRRPPNESRADSVMYCRVLAEVSQQRGWAVHRYDAKVVEVEAGRIVGADADVLSVPRRTLGPPWTKDHRVALAATIVAETARWSG